MDLGQVEKVAMEEPAAMDCQKNKRSISNTSMGGDKDQHDQKKDPSSALQSFLNHIPISSLPGIKSPPGLSLSLC